MIEEVFLREKSARQDANKLFLFGYGLIGNPAQRGSLRRPFAKVEELKLQNRFPKVYLSFQKQWIIYMIS